VRGAITPGLETDCINRGIDFRNSNDALDKFLEFVAFLNIDWLEVHTPRVFKAFIIHVPIMTTAAPRICADTAAASPTGPAPAT